MKYRNIDKSTLNSVVLGGLVVDVESESIKIRFENLSKPRLGWYHQNAMIGKKKDNDSCILVILPNGTEPPLVGSLVAVHGVLVADFDGGSVYIMAESVDDVTAHYSKAN